MKNETPEEKNERTFAEIDALFDFLSKEEKPVNCQICNDSKVELVYGGHGNILEFPCSMCCEKENDDL